MKVKSIKLEPVPPSIPSEALVVEFFDIHSASSCIAGGTSCSFIFFRVDIVSSNRVTENSSTIWRKLRGEHFIRKN